jgi:hypothetical protein
MADSEKISPSYPLETHSDHEDLKGSPSNYSPPAHVENTSFPHQARVATTMSDVAHISEHEARLRLGLHPHTEHGALVVSLHSRYKIV